MMFYYEIKMKNTDYGSFEVVAISPEAMKLIYEYLKEAIFTDGKRPLTENEYKTMNQFLYFYDQTNDTRLKFKQSGLD